MTTLMKIIAGIVIGSVALSLVGTVLGLAMGLIGLVFSLGLPLLIVGGLGAFIYAMFRHGYNSSRTTCRKPMNKAEVLMYRVKEAFTDFFRQGSTSDQQRTAADTQEQTEDVFTSFFHQNGQ